MLCNAYDDMAIFNYHNSQGVTQAKGHTMVDENLYHRRMSYALMKCISHEEGSAQLSDIHGGKCGKPCLIYCRTLIEKKTPSKVFTGLLSSKII
jgi:hypothetical protein